MFIKGCMAENPQNFLSRDWKQLQRDHQQTERWVLSSQKTQLYAAFRKTINLL
jgi:hypothetical protein